MTATWDDRWLDRKVQLYRARITAAAAHVAGQAKRNVSIPSRTVSFGGGRSGTSKVLGARGSARSRPGEFPHKDFGTFRAGITYDAAIVEGDQITARVGTPSKVGKFLELGTSKMAPRPWLRRTAKEERPTIVQTITLGGRTDISVG